MTSLRDFIIGIVLIASFVQIECTLSGELNDYVTHVINILPPINKNYNECRGIYVQGVRFT